MSTSMNPRTAAPQPPSDQTRQALIRAALKLFGTKGFDGTSTREIAAAANANIGSIAYHFGGKEGLRAAWAAFVDEPTEGAGTHGLRMDAEGRKGEAAAVARLNIALERMVSFVVAAPQ